MAEGDTGLSGMGGLCLCVWVFGVESLCWVGASRHAGHGCAMLGLAARWCSCRQGGDKKCQAWCDAWRILEVNGFSEKLNKLTGSGNVPCPLLF